MSKYKVKILSNEKLAQNIYKLVIEKPIEYSFIPGQFAEISISNGLQNSHKNSFSFTGGVDYGKLEFIIKPCKNPDTLAKKMVSLRPNDELIISEPRGTLQYKGKGAFIAGGTGITPFVAILRDLKRRNTLAGNTLIYSNKTMNDVILHDELVEMLGLDYINVFTQQRLKSFYFGRIDRNYLRMEIIDFARYFYVSGPGEFINDIISILKNFGVGADSIIFEETAIQNAGELKTINNNNNFDLIG